MGSGKSRSKNNLANGKTTKLHYFGHVTRHNCLTERYCSMKSTRKQEDRKIKDSMVKQHCGVDRNRRAPKVA